MGYRGALGETRTERVLYTCPGGTVKPVEVYRCVNASTHPELAGKLREGTLNRVECADGERATVNVPVIFHDPAAPVFALVIPDCLRHTELSERSELLAALADEREYELPDYVRSFAVAFGADELSDLLAEREDAGAREERAAEVEQELAKRRARLEEDESALAAERAELERVIAELEQRNQELVARTEKLTEQLEAEVVPPADPDGTPLPRPVPHEEIETHPFELMPKSEKTDEDSTTVGGTTDVAIERWIVSREPELKYVDAAGVRFAVAATPAELEAMLEDDLPIRVQVHRLPTFPLVVLALGAVGGKREPFCFLFDITAERARNLLNALGREFAFRLHLFDREYLPVKRRDVTADLADNVRYALGAADAHLDGLDASERSFSRASLLWSSPEFDKHGRHRPERALFRRELFDRLETPAQVREAVAMVSQFSKPALEELLVLVWGEPLVRWNKQRGKVVLKAVELGLWPGPELASIAVSAGAARSRKDLVHRLQANFARLIAAGSSGLDEGEIEANMRALEQAASGGGASPGEIRSGVIDDKPAAGNGEPAVQEELLLSALSVSQLVELLDDRKRRRDAAVELANRGDPHAIAPTFRALQKMTRAEAVHVLGNVVKYGDAVSEALRAGLHSGKGFLRHGCALALGVLKDEAGIEAVCDQLLSEPTEIWRELARSIGEVGPNAVMSLVARLRDQDDQGRERIAWALANVAARGGREPVETLARGRDPVASGVARHALHLSDLAQNDDRAVRGPSAPRDQTVNRAFSRKFFEAMNRPDASDDEDALLLDEADLIDADAEVLDESDLIPT